MSGGRRGGGKGARGPQDRETQVSKKLSWILRHGAEKEGLKLDERGYANCADLLKWQTLRSFKVTFAELRSIVETNAKQRFQLIPIFDDGTPTTAPSESFPSDTVPPPDPAPADGNDPSRFLIRASQGHSLAIASSALLAALDPADPSTPRLVVHGTNPGAWKAIQKSGGLSRMGRGHVHFAEALPGEDSPTTGTGKGAVDLLVDQDQGKTAAEGEEAAELDSALPAATDGPSTTQGKKVISGMRASASIMVWVDVKRSAEEGGLKWWRSANGVVLTEGDEKGLVEMEWVERVEKRGRDGRNGEVVWRKGDQ